MRRSRSKRRNTRSNGRGARGGAASLSRGPSGGAASADTASFLCRTFTLGELLRSETAERQPALKVQQFNPPADVVSSLKYLARATLQPLRDRIGTPIRITSGYRCKDVNALVGGSATSQHVRGEAADCQLFGGFMVEDTLAPVREMIRAGVKRLVGRPLRDNVSENFYLFAFVCLHLEELDVDQVIHEYGEAHGRPAWVHIASSQQRNKRQILTVGDYTGKKYLAQSPAEALEQGT